MAGRKGGPGDPGEDAAAETKAAVSEATLMACLRAYFADNPDVYWIEVEVVPEGHGRTARVTVTDLKAGSRQFLIVGI
jgi:hypothetical protein